MQPQQKVIDGVTSDTDTCCATDHRETLLTGAAIAIDAKSWPDVVVWSPWTSMDCYKHFVLRRERGVQARYSGAW